MSERVYLCALSDPITDRSRYEKLKPEFEKQGIVLELSPLLEKDLPAPTKADDFNKALRSGRYSWIVDVSGGNLANLVLPYLDYEAYQSGSTYYAAFSDGTCIVNALAARAHKKAMLFPIWNQTDFGQTISLFKTRKMPTTIEPMNQANPMPRHGRIFGGNIRCFLKLAGTDGFPDLSDGYLLLESSSANWNAFRSMSAHLAQIGALDSLCGIILGRFNVLERQAQGRENALRLMAAYLDSLLIDSVDFYRADGIGHIATSQGIWISAGKPLLKQGHSPFWQSEAGKESASQKTQEMPKPGPVQKPIGASPTPPRKQGNDHHRIKTNPEVNNMTGNNGETSKNKPHSYTISTGDVYITPFASSKKRQ